MEVANVGELPGIGRTDETVLRLTTFDQPLGIDFIGHTVRRVLPGQPGEKLAGAVPFKVRKWGGDVVTDKRTLTEAVKKLREQRATEHVLVYERCQKLFTIKLPNKDATLGVNLKHENGNVLITAAEGPFAAVPVGSYLKSVNSVPTNAAQDVANAFNAGKQRGMLEFIVGIEEMPNPIIPDDSQPKQEEQMTVQAVQDACNVAPATAPDMMGYNNVQGMHGDYPLPPPGQQQQQQQQFPNQQQFPGQQQQFPNQQQQQQFPTTNQQQVSDQQQFPSQHFPISTQFASPEQGGQPQGQYSPQQSTPGSYTQQQPPPHPQPNPFFVPSAQGVGTENRLTIAAPNMPDFEPTHSDADADFFDKIRANCPPSEDIKKFEFPADHGFWENFRQQILLSGEKATRPPHYGVRASHESDSVLSVNRDFVRTFVRSWALMNPHEVTVTSPTGQVSFQVSDEFWNKLTSRLQRNPGGGGRVLTIASSLHPNTNVYASPDEYRTLVQDWEESKGTTHEQKTQKDRQRWVQVMLLEKEKSGGQKSTPRGSKQVTTGTQWVDPKEFIFVDELPEVLEQNRRPPFVSSLRSPWAPVDEPRCPTCSPPTCKECGSAKREHPTTTTTTSSSSSPRRLSDHHMSALQRNEASLRAHDPTPASPPAVQMGVGSGTGTGTGSPHGRDTGRRRMEAVSSAPTLNRQYSLGGQGGGGGGQSRQPANVGRRDVGGDGGGGGGSDYWVSFVKDWEGLATAMKAKKIKPDHPYYG